MSEKQNPGLDEDDAAPVEDEQPDGAKGSSPKSYYYDDSTGYEIYNEKSDDDDDEATGDGESRGKFRPLFNTHCQMLPL